MVDVADGDGLPSPGVSQCPLLAHYLSGSSHYALWGLAGFPSLFQLLSADPRLCHSGTCSAAETAGSAVAKLAIGTEGVSSGGAC